LISAHKNKEQIFAAMFQLRTSPLYKNVKELLDSGELGRLTRVVWLITSWFRTETYYASGGWRATWKGEGGGVLLNQCPHNLDLLQWFCGMPSRVSGFCSFGKYHDIEVEDEVTAYLEYPNGATGVFVTTTGEAPGTDRLEICGELGKIVVENNTISFTRNEVSMFEFSRTSDKMFAVPDVRNIEIPAEDTGGQHVEITQNFTDAILGNAPLIAPAEEGIRSVELGNAMLYSSVAEKAVDLPLDGAEYEKMLKKLIRESKFEKKSAKKKSEDMNASFH
jgi:predicted dehydrogenase